MKSLFAAVTEAREAGADRRLCDLFMVKPSKKDYPDYYQVILEPMDLRTIEQNIRTERYSNEEALMNDMRLMFRNARHYNEEGSQVRAKDNFLLIRFYFLFTMLSLVSLLSLFLFSWTGHFDI